MTRVTLNNVNRALKAAGLDYELVRGNGYFYFWPLSDGTPELENECVMTLWLKDDTVDGWVETCRSKIDGGY